MMKIEKVVTAGMLREWGFEIPDSIPDIACVPAGSIKIVSQVPLVNDDYKKRIYEWSVNIEFSEPFRWFSSEVGIGKD